ncbi:hypothetical protein GCM10011586_35080 [Silvibacterium dinghuense]|nr:hypothetical protein GCM10011586_35080 [Silvibacterium dinghuense]
MATDNSVNASVIESAAHRLRDQEKHGPCAVCNRAISVNNKLRIGCWFVNKQCASAFWKARQA